jgi:hypothetical protein
VHPHDSQKQAPSCVLLQAVVEQQIAAPPTSEGEQGVVFGACRVVLTLPQSHCCAEACVQ